MENNLTTVIVALLSGLLGWLIKSYFERRRYLQDYWKTVINKRLEAYEAVNEALIDLYTVTGFNSPLYHRVFLEKDTYINFYRKLNFAMKFRFWYSSELVDELVKLSVSTAVDFDLNETERLKTYGQERCKDIATLVDEITLIINEDYFKMSDVGTFLKTGLKARKCHSREGGNSDNLKAEK